MADRHWWPARAGVAHSGGEHGDGTGGQDPPLCRPEGRYACATGPAGTPFGTSDMLPDWSAWNSIR